MDMHDSSTCWIGDVFYKIRIFPYGKVRAGAKSFP